MPVQGRATVEMQIKLKEARQEGVTGGQLNIVVDGYNAPVTGGNFVDLVQRGFYNNMEIQRADGFVVQTGDPGPPARTATSGYVTTAFTSRSVSFQTKALLHLEVCMQWTCVACPEVMEFAQTPPAQAGDAADVRPSWVSLRICIPGTR